MERQMNVSMKRLTLQALLLATLAAQPLLALADHNDDDRRGRNSGALEWRLGSDLGYRGTEIYYRYPGERGWVRAPGSAVDVGDGWVIGTDRRSGGYGIYRWSGNNWQRMPGAAIEIGGSYQNPWVVNDRGERFRWAGYEWRREAVVGYGDREDKRRSEREERRRDRDDWRQGYRDEDRGEGDDNRR